MIDEVKVEKKETIIRGPKIHTGIGKYTRAMVEKAKEIFEEREKEWEQLKYQK